ncbi:hypothetical protein FX985_02961 [Pseudomonas extremaustralis]|uniref:Uncharacterized protein n=1 Tax=Pseudomonas extremaustralis TaxID=359110 RepID=A0A5M9J1G4_9PSED|nr:hypothetical protein FX985_02961 [Pseudomonas extremaustralis]
MTMSKTPSDRLRGHSALEHRCAQNHFTRHPESSLIDHSEHNARIFGSPKDRLDFLGILSSLNAWPGIRRLRLLYPD